MDEDEVRVAMQQLSEISRLSSYTFRLLGESVNSTQTFTASMDIRGLEVVSVTARSWGEAAIGLRDYLYQMDPPVVGKFVN